MNVKKYDLIVVGGGLTGVAAAVSAAREGMQVLLLEKAGALGGAMSNCFVYPFMMYWTKSPETGEKQYLSGGLFTEMRKRQGKVPYLFLLQAADGGFCLSVVGKGHVLPGG